MFNINIITAYPEMFPGILGHSILGKALSENKINLSSLSNLKPSFRLSPPKGGFRKSTRRMYSQGGTLGYNPDLSKLISNMV